MNSDAIVKTSFQGLMDSIEKSKYPLIPIYEAITNSLEAVVHKNYENGEIPQITITFDFIGILEEQHKLNYISIFDNGIGLDEENYKRFETLLDKSKGFNNKGSGRLQLLHRFSRVEIESFYRSNGEYFKRSFCCNATNFIYEPNVISAPTQHSSSTKLTLIPGDTLGRDQEYYNTLELTTLIRELKQHFLLRFYLDAEKEDGKKPNINIVFSKNGHEQGRGLIKSEDLPKPFDTGKLEVSYLRLKDAISDDVEWTPVPNKNELLKWAHFKLPEKDMDHNSVSLCARGVPISFIHFDGIKKREPVKGSYYITAFYGELLDNNVSDSADSFSLPSQAQIEEKIKEGDLFLPDMDFLFFDTVKQEINKVIPQIYQDIIDLKILQNLRAEEIAREHGISPEIAATIKVNPGDSKERITEKLYKAQSEGFAKEYKKIRKVFNELNALDPKSSNYQKELEKKSTELLAMIPRQNKEELGRYVIRREMVAEVLNKIVNQTLDCQNLPTEKGKKEDKEGLIHDLIFKRKSKDTGVLNDLWILSEEYVHFDGCSEVRINQIEDSKGQKLLRNVSDADLEKYGIKPTRRPDIFLYAEEGKCVIIELKATDVDLSDHLNQMTKYCNLIANFSTTKIEKFYCYLIGENISPMDFPGDYDLTVNGDRIKSSLPIRSYKEGKEDLKIAYSQIEVIKLSSLYERAHRRNKSFADKLGLRVLLEKK